MPSWLPNSDWVQRQSPLQEQSVCTHSRQHSCLRMSSLWNSFWTSIGRTVKAEAVFSCWWHFFIPDIFLTPGDMWHYCHSHSKHHLKDTRVFWVHSSTQPRLAMDEVLLSWWSDFEFRREEWNLEENRVVIRDGKFNQVHMIHTETMGEHEVKCVSFGCFTYRGKLKESQILLKSEANEEEGSKHIYWNH